MKENFKKIMEWVIDILIAVIIAGAVMFFVKPIIVQQTSMLPNFEPGDYVLASRQAYTFLGDVDYEDVVIFKTDLKAENGKDKNLIKRVIGLPGDQIEIVDGYVYRNGEKIDEWYVAEAGASGNMSKVTVPEGKLFCCGDNRRVSLDSRSSDVGFVDMDQIIGRVFQRIYPFNKIQAYK